MRYFILVVFISQNLSAFAQLSEIQQKKFDSLYVIATDKTESIINRKDAYRLCCWKTTYVDYKLGLKVSSEFLMFAKSNNLEDNISSACHYKGYAEMMLGKYDLAETTYKFGLKIASINKNYSRIAEAYGNLGNLNKALGKTEVALNFYNLSLELAEEKKFFLAQARAKINLGEIYEEQGLYKKSLETYSEALEICDEHFYGGYRSSIYESLGDINLSIKEYKTANEYYQEALHWAEKHENSNRQIQSFAKLGKLQFELNKFAEAEGFYNKGLSLAISKNVPSLTARIYSNLAQVQLAQEHFKEGLKYIIISIDLFEKYGIVENLDEAYLIAAKLYQKVDAKQKCKYYFQKSYEAGMTNKNIQTIKSSSLSLAEIYDSEGKNAISLNYYKTHIEYSALKRDKDDIKEIIRNSLQEDYHQKRITDSLNRLHEIERLKFSHNQKQEKSNMRSLFAYGGIVSLFIILLFVGYLFYQKKKSASLLGVKNEIIAQALQDKEILLKEVHHRVKNNMQVVSSLLNLKSRNTVDESAKAALLDSQKRIDSMQLAHHRMYQKGNYEQINIVEYCQDIVGLLLTPIKTEKDHFVVEGNDIWLHVDQAQALGFIVHELIANSIKYAWILDEKKEVKITLSKIDQSFFFNYIDNGRGLPSNFDIEKTKSFGMKLIYSLATGQLDGEIEVKHNTKGINISVKFNWR